MRLRIRYNKGSPVVVLPRSQKTTIGRTFVFETTEGEEGNGVKDEGMVVKVPGRESEE